ncbi:YhfZ family protein [Escherichia coli]
MRGTDIRVEYLLNSVSDVAVVSRLAAKAISRKEVMPGAESGAARLRRERRLNCRKGESANVKRVGLDNRSADQKS